MNALYPLIDRFKYRHSVVNKSSLPYFFHTHPKYEIYYFHSGNCQYKLGNRTIDLVPGDLIVMNGMTEHGPVVNLNEPYVRTMLLFDKAYIKPLLNDPDAVDVLMPFEEMGNVHLRLESGVKEELEHILGRMINFYRKSDPVAYNRLKMAFMDLLLLIYEQSQKLAAASPLAGKEKSIQKVLAFLEQNYTKPITMNLLEENLHISRFYLMRMFKEQTGMTVFDYLKQRRINQAKIMLRYDRDRSVTDICYQVGFKHPAHFSRTFKHYEGVSPEQYRKMARP